MLQKYKKGRETNPPQKKKSPETKMQERGKEGQDGWGQPKRKCNIRLERERERERDSRLSQNIDRVHSLTHSLTHVPFFFSQAPIDRQHRSPTKQQEWRNQKAPPSTKPSVCLSVCLSVAGEESERRRRRRRKEGRWLKLRPDRSARLLYGGGPTNKNPRKPF